MSGQLHIPAALPSE